MIKKLERVVYFLYIFIFISCSQTKTTKNIYKEKEINPRATYYIGLANHSFEQKNYDLAYKNLIKAKIFNSESIYIKNKIVETIYAIINQDKKLFNGIKYLEDKFSLNLSEGEPFYKLSGLFHMIQGNIVVAESYFLDEINSNKQTGKGVFKILAYIYNKQQRFDKEIFIMEKAVKLYPNDDYLLNWLGYSLVINTENYSYAKRLLNKAISFDPTNLYYHDSMAWLYYKRGNYKKALEQIKDFISLDIKHSEILYHIGMIYIKLNEKEVGKKYLQLAIEKKNDDRIILKAKEELRKINNEK